MILHILAGIVVFILVCIAAFFLITRYLINKHRKDETYLELKVEERTEAKLLSLTEDEVDFQVEVPFENPAGRGATLFLDAFVRMYMPDEQYDKAQLRCNVDLESHMREDDYFEALIVQSGMKDKLVLRFELKPRNGAETAKEALLGLPDVPVALFIERRGRMEVFYTKKIFTLTEEELRAMVK